MPIYEYGPKDHECGMCDGRVEVMQSIHDDALTACPRCGLDVVRLISRASFQMDKTVNYDDAAKKGFTTYKKAGDGQYERVAGEAGPDTLSADD